MTILYRIQPLAHVALAGIMVLAPVAAQTASENEIRFREAIHKEQVEGDLTGAMKTYQTLASAKGNRSLAAKALVQLGRCYEKQGNIEARKLYERVLREFADQARAAEDARMRLAKMNASRPPTEVTARRLTELLPVFGPRTVTRDGRYTVYVNVRRSVIMLLDLVTGKERELGGGRRLVPPGDFSREAAISPDGPAAVYNHVHADGTSDLCFLGVNAKELRVLQRGLNNFRIADWSRDGSTVLIIESQPTANRDPLRALVVDVRSGEMKTVFRPPQRGSAILPSQQRFVQFRISPDGKFLAHTFSESPQDSGTGVFTIAVGEDKPYKITGVPADSYVFGWSPDGRQLLYVSNQSGSNYLWAVPVKDGRPTGVPVLLKRDFGLMQGSGVADDGKLYYSSYSTIGNLYVGDLDVQAAVVRNVHQIPQPPGHLSGTATWSSDGSRLLIDRTSPSVHHQGNHT
jgi:Tol biopolymer transport system component